MHAGEALTSIRCAAKGVPEDSFDFFFDISPHGCLVWDSLVTMLGFEFIGHPTLLGPAKR